MLKHTVPSYANPIGLYLVLLMAIVHHGCAYGLYWRAGGSSGDFLDSHTLSAMQPTLMTMVTMMTPLARSVTLNRLQYGLWPSYQSYAVAAPPHSSSI